MNSAMEKSVLLLKPGLKVRRESGRPPGIFSIAPEWSGVVELEDWPIWTTAWPYFIDAPEIRKGETEI
jgi:hypothetical protein